MISRRSFLKTAGIATLSLGAGFGLGSFTKINSKSELISIYGFLPNDKELVYRVFSTLGKQIGSEAVAKVRISGNTGVEKVVEKGLSEGSTGGFVSGISANVRVSGISSSTISDILIRKEGRVLSPEYNYDSMLSGLRKELKQKEASYFFTAEISKKSFLTGLLESPGKLIIENNSGIIDEIDLDRKESEIIIAGDCGNTVVSFGRNSAHVKSASCRNKICQHNQISAINPVIACAPNGLILRLG